MAERIVQEESLVAVADAIRAKGGTTDPLSFPTGFADAIAAIQTGGGGGGETSQSDAVIERTATTYENNSITAIGKHAFRECSTLTRVSCGSVTTIKDYAFSKCTNLTEADFPVVKNIGSDAFSDCGAKLTNINFPEVTTINSYAFDDCSGLTYVEFPKLTQITTYAFNRCSALKALVLRNVGQVVYLANKSAFTSTPIASGTGFVYVPAALVASYQSASNWSNYAAQIRAIEDYPDITGG
jgi:hypothetical protein